jgi:arylsulfatase A-like enzyme
MKGRQVVVTGELIKEFKEILSEALIIFTSDHGEEFGAHGKFQHNVSLYESVIRIPLIFSGNGVKKGIRIKNLVSHLEVSPTIIDLIGIEKVKSFYGESLLPLMDNKQWETKNVISSCILHAKKETLISYRTEDWKYILRCKEKKIIRRELYNLREDPKELINLEKEEKEKSKIFEKKILKEYFAKKGIFLENISVKFQESEENNQFKEETLLD